MMPSSYAQKHFSSAHRRFFDAAIHRFFKEHFPNFLGEELLKLITEKLMDLIQTYAFEITRIRPGQMLWIAIDKNTRADSRKVRYKPVVLTLVNPDEIETLEQESQSLPGMTSTTIARMCTEAFEQGALLSMRDIGLILKRSCCHISSLRKDYEKEHNVQLPTPAVIQDMGSGVTHKAAILRKVLIEKKDMAVVRNETYHTQQAIDRYLKDYRRVEMLLNENKDIFYIAQITQLSVFLIKQYQKIYHETTPSK
jgi:hypothetical protein